MANTVKPIILTIGNDTYTLEFNRDTVMSAERNGLTIQEVMGMSMPITTLMLLFYAAFKMHHPEMTREQTDSILIDKLNGLQHEEIQRLRELYAAPVETLIRDESDGERKNATISL